MPRPARSQWVHRTYARRRHRTWVASMVLASLGWGTWWVALGLHRFAPGAAPSLELTEGIGIAFALPGLGLALMTVRARRTWLLFVCVAVLANASILGMPWLVAGLRDWR